MKTPKINLIAFAALSLLVALTPLSRAQETPGQDAARPERPARSAGERRGGAAGANQLERIAERLKLTDEQKTKLQPILREEAAKLRELRQDTTLAGEERRTKVREVREQFLAKMKPILSTQQFEELKKMREQAQNRGQRGGGQRGEGQRRREGGDSPRQE